MLKPFEQMLTTRVKYNRMCQSRSHIINKGLCIPMPFREKKKKIPGNCGGFRSIAAVSEVSGKSSMSSTTRIVLLVGHDKSSLPMRDTIHPHSNYLGVSITISSARTAHVRVWEYSRAMKPELNLGSGSQRGMYHLTCLSHMRTSSVLKRLYGKYFKVHFLLVITCWPSSI